MWSEDTKNLTRKHLQKFPIAPMKHVDRGCGFLTKNKENQFIISDDSTKEEMTYDTVEELLEAGWVID